MEQGSTPTSAVIDKQHSPEELQPSIDLLRTQEFHDGFLDVSTQEQQEAVATHTGEAEKKLMGIVGEDVDGLTATRLGVSIEEGRKLGLQWGQTRKDVASESDDAGLTLLERLKTKHSGEIYTEDFQTESTRLESEVEQSAFAASELLSSIISDIDEHKDDPEFIEAAKKWANSPNSKGEIGENGSGFNAGIIHFFEYRGSKEKSGRFAKIPETMSTSGFIEYTTRMHDVVRGVTEQTDADSGVHGAVLSDGEGNERVFALTSSGEKVIGFKPNDGEDYLMTSIIVGQSEKGLQKDIDSVVDGKDRGVLNKLNGPAEILVQV